MSAAVEEQMVVKAIREECPWESLPKRLQSTLHTKDEWHRSSLLLILRESTPMRIWISFTKVLAISWLLKH
ncbi:hypothetical protein TRIUR3_07954 [Triticum urartu]|uniref:Uncharacterized protein n=1 Tax=Triticum urartu TaxID=4572 RepID=M7ZCF1_TRIUA|nr:hypothetical protein TRIUR3_07954 [Triticum urartu]